LRPEPLCVRLSRESTVGRFLGKISECPIARACARVGDRHGLAFAGDIAIRGGEAPVISIEVELKLAVAAADLAALTRALVAMMPGAVTVRRALVATYFDTSDLALRQAGSTLRLREQDGCFVQTFKTADFGGANLLARGEWQDTVAENRPDPQAPHSGPHLPEEVACNLKPLFVTEVSRETVVIEPSPETRIEAAIDTGEIRAIDNGRSEPISEIELELEYGDPTALFDLALRLLETAPVRIETRSKSERGYRLVAAAEPPPAVHAEPPSLDPRMVIEEAMRRVGCSCLTHMLRNEPAALAGQPEGVHQMRVAVRRLRSLLSAVKKLLPEDALRPVADELAGLAAPLGPARNLDVFAGELLLPLRVAHAGGEPGWEPLAAAAERARAEAYIQVDKEILSPRHTGAALRLLRWFEGRGWRSPQGSATPAPLASPIGASAPGILDRRRRAVRKRSRRFAVLTPRERHRLRIAVKKLRYTVELLGSLYDRDDLRRYTKRLKRVQEDLGHANDLRVAYGLAVELSRHAEPPEPVVDAAAQLLAWHERALALGERKLRRQLRRLNRAEPFWRG
jgi:inorganic triphosphatase YgiF